MILSLGPDGQFKCAVTDERIMDRPKMPSELRLLISCLRAALGRVEDAGVSALCRRPVDWDSFIKLVNRHRVISPVYLGLKQFAGDRIPEAVLGDLESRYRWNAQQVLAKSAELVRIVNRFGEKGIEALPFKGPVLALKAYGDLGSRHVGDLDIMVAPEQALEAEGVLLKEGYRRTHPAFELTPKQKLAYIRSIHHFGYLSQERRIKVELHWRFGSIRHLFPLRFHDFWKDRQTIKLGGADLAALSLDHTILLLCTHGAIHAWSRLFWLNDVACLMKKHGTIDWHRLTVHASRLGIGRMVAEGIILSNLFLAAPLPDPIRAFSEKDKGVERLVKTSLYLITHNKPRFYRPSTPAYWHSKFNLFMLRSDQKYKLGFCFHHMGASYGDWSRFPLPDAIFPIYYLIRPYSWLFRWYIRGTEIYLKKTGGRTNGAT